MIEGKVHAALQLVTQANRSGPMPLINLLINALHILLEKHPPKQPPKHSSIIKLHVPLA